MSDYAKVQRDETRKARKEYRCCECAGIIREREKYHIFTGLWDNWQQYRTCFHCDELRKELVNDGHSDWEDLWFGNLIYYIFDSDNPLWMKKMIDIMYKRATVVPDWMLKRLEEDKFKAGRVRFGVALLKI